MMVAKQSNRRLLWYCLALHGLLTPVFVQANTPYPVQRIATDNPGLFIQLGMEKKEAVGMILDAAPEVDREMGDNPDEISHNGLNLVFDHDKTKRIGFGEGFDFSLLLTPFKEEWKNFRAIEGKHVYAGMPYEELLAYIEKWSQQAMDAGHNKGDRARDLEEGEFVVRITRCTAGACEGDDAPPTRIVIYFGPPRFYYKGGNYNDEWRIKLASFDHSSGEHGEAPLLGVSAFAAEFQGGGSLMTADEFHKRSIQAEAP